MATRSSKATKVATSTPTAQTALPIKATTAAIALKTKLTPVSFSSDSKRIGYKLPITTAALKKNFPGVDEVRITAYISGNIYINSGARGSADEETLYLSKAEASAWLKKNKLPNITEPKVFGASRQIVASKNTTDANKQAKLAEHISFYEMSI